MLLKKNPRHTRYDGNNGSSYAFFSTDNAEKKDQQPTIDAQQAQPDAQAKDIAVIKKKLGL